MDDEDYEEEEAIEYPAWTQPLCGWVYRIDQYDDGSVDIPDLPEFLTVEFFDDGSCKATIDLAVISADSSEVEGDDVDEVFSALDELLSPLGELFNKPAKRK
jgi:hypothetical protein